MSILFRIAFRVDTKSYPEYYEQQRLETETSRSHTSKIDQHRVGAVDREGLVHSIPALTPEYLLLSQWVLPLRYLFTLYRNVAQLRPVTDIAPHFGGVLTGTVAEEPSENSEREANIQE